MKKIFLIYGHYDDKSFNAAIRDTFIETAKNKGHVFATNGYIANTIGCTEITVSNWISQLKKSGHIFIKYNPHRQIYVKSYSKN